MRPLLVRDLMTEGVFTLGPLDDLTALYGLADAEHIRHIPVVGKEGELEGLVTHRDLLRSALSGTAGLPLSLQRETLRRRTVKEIMITAVETIQPDRPIGDAAQIMLDNKYGCLPVLEGGKLVGILTEADFVKCLVGMIPGVHVTLHAEHHEPTDRDRGGPGDHPAPRTPRRKSG